MMKYIGFFLILLSFVLSSCHDKSDEPPTEKYLPVVESYLPATVSFNINDNGWVEKVKEWSDKRLVVNDASELPDDPFGFSNAYRGIDFSRYTLLVSYEVHNWTIDTYYNRFYWDNIENAYNWAISIKSGTIPDSSSEEWYFSRFTILVNKIPADADIRIWMSLGALNWNWD